MNARRFASLAGTIAVTVIAAIASYDHMRTVALDAGQSPLLAALLPLSVDGMILVATLALGDGRRSKASAWAAFLTGVAASLAANVMAAAPDATARVVSAWPAVALLLTVEVLARAGRAPVATPTPAPAARADVSPPVPAPSLVASTVADNGRADVGRAADVTPSPVATPRPKATPRPPSRQSAADAIRSAARDAGATPATVAAALGVSVRTCQRHWPRPTVATSVPALAAVTA
ncbi:DUF2637 domain-containing protein [Micromonospora sp. NPDC004540]|uniref:DUF2637 domain-containing protein n=1 Tax=Micromonospora sp. NPDC004540 TaxID=3154457 RepID=UPI0033B600DA